MERLSLHEVEKYSKPPIAPQFFSKFTLTAKRWILVEEDNYTLDSCLPEGATMTKISDPSFRWYGPNSETLEVDPSRARAFDNGQLEIRHPRKEDTGRYICEVTSRTESDVRLEYERTYAVFSHPEVVLIRYYYMQSKACDENLNVRILDQALRTFCRGEPECGFSFTADTCLMDSEESFETRFSIYQVLPSWYADDLSEKCGIECKRNKSLIILYETSKPRAEEFEQNLKFLYMGATGELLYLDEKTRSHVNYMCPEGYVIYNDIVCMPCDRGHYKQITLHCERCGAFSYQDKIGQSGCIGCDYFKLTAAYGAKNEEDCIYFYQSWIAMLIIVPSITVVLLNLIGLCIFYRVTGAHRVVAVIRRYFRSRFKRNEIPKSYAPRVDSSGVKESRKLLIRPADHYRSKGQRTSMDNLDLHSMKEEISDSS